jgi:hypothetical protein
MQRQALLFEATDSSGSRGLWETNGTAGTHELTGISGANITGLSGAGLSPYGLTNFNGEVLFNGLDTNGRNALWVTDGASAGTHELIGISGANALGLAPQELTVFNNEVLFNGFDASSGHGLWTTNGTVGGYP